MLAKEVAATRPDLVLHTGDLAEHGGREPAGPRELRRGMGALEAMGAPIIVCRGNHDGDRAWRDICGPHAPKRWDGPGVHVLTLDYPTFAAPDAFGRLEANLAAIAGTGGRIFLAAHAPAYALARPFFTDHAYAEAIRVLAARYPIDALFCGHTHNQAWSLHTLPGGVRWMQVKGAAVGSPDRAPQPLGEVRAICGDPTLLWGFLEDTAPGWNEVILDGPWVLLRWHALGGGVGAEARWHVRGEVALTVRPPAAPDAATPFRLSEATAAWMDLAGYGCPEGRRVWLNGQPVGVTPALSSFAPRQTVALPPAALHAVNTVEIETLAADRLLVGGLSIVVRLSDGSVRRTPVDPWLHTTADSWDVWREPRLRHVRSGDRILTTLAFTPSSPQGPR
jgi:predicted phosphodiesterase